MAATLPFLTLSPFFPITWSRLSILLQLNRVPLPSPLSLDLITDELCVVALMLVVILMTVMMILMMILMME
jgi:hypothetical protein